MCLLTKLFNFVLVCVSKYNIDESHGLSHAMNILTCANKIYTQEVEKQPYLKDHEKIIYVSSDSEDDDVPSEPSRYYDSKYISRKQMRINIPTRGDAFGTRILITIVQIIGNKFLLFLKPLF